MNHIFTSLFRLLFAAILTTATLTTIVVLSPLLLLIWLWKKLRGTPPPR